MAQVVEIRSDATRIRVAAEVRAWMGRLRIRQVALAEYLGLSQASVSDRLNGKAQFTLDELDMLAERFGIDVSELLAPASRREGSDTRQAA